MSREQDLNNLLNAGKMALQKQKEFEDDPYAEFLVDEEESVSPPLERGSVIPTGEVTLARFASEREVQIEEEAGELPEMERLFEEGPFVSDVALWKKEYGQNKVMHIELCGRHYIFRTLNRFEYKSIVAMENTDSLFREEIICRTCVLWPMQPTVKSMAEDDAGLPSSISKIIMESSGFTMEYGIEVL